MCVRLLLTRQSSADWNLDFYMKTTLAHQLADYACALRFEDLSNEVVHEVKRRVIDSLGCRSAHGRKSRL